MEHGGNVCFFSEGSGQTSVIPEWSGCCEYVRKARVGEHKPTSKVFLLREKGRCGHGQQCFQWDS